MKKLNGTMTLEQQQSLQRRLIELVNEKKSGHCIAKELGINYTTVHRWLRKLGLNLPNYHNELKFDNTVFDTIDTEEKAYWLGFLYADGYVSSNGVTVELSLKGDDAEHLNKFANFLRHKEGIRFGKIKLKGKEYSRCRLILTSQHINDALVKLGCIPNKSLILTFPDISIFTTPDLVKHFIRGYVDGDGCIYIGQGYAAFNILGTRDFLDGIIRQFPEIKFCRLHKDRRHSKSNTYYITLGGKEASKFGDMLYKDATICLKRKYDKFIENRYDEREHFRRMHTFSEKKQLYFARSRNRVRENLN